MKTTKLVVLGLVGLSVAALAAPTAKAETKDATSKAKVTFETNWPVFTPNSKEDKLNEDGTIKDKNAIEIQFPNAIDGSTVKGSTLPVKEGAVDLTANKFDIIYVTDFDFGTHNYNGSKMTAFAEQPDFTAIDAANQTAANNAPLGLSIGSLGNTPVWSLTAKMTPFYKGGVEAPADAIAGTKVTLHNVTANNVLDKKNNAKTFDEKTDLVLEGNNSKTEENVTTTKIGSFSNGTGMAINNFAFGSVETTEAGDKYYEGVELEIPAGANIENAEYIATITWTISNAAF